MRTEIEQAFIDQFRGENSYEISKLNRLTGCYPIDRCECIVAPLPDQIGCYKVILVATEWFPETGSIMDLLDISYKVTLLVWKPETTAIYSLLAWRYINGTLDRIVKYWPELAKTIENELGIKPDPSRF